MIGTHRNIMPFNDTPPPVIIDPTQEQLRHSPVDWLRSLGQPTWIDISGRDTRRRRIITTLLHGNEPSGLLALYRWLKQGITPTINLSFLIASVDAALHEPLFSQRMLVGSRDLNRCFSAPFEDTQGHLANHIIERIDQLNPECIVDIHNTSGSGPSFAVSINNDFSAKALARVFCRRIIVTDFRLGSLMEIDAGCPIVTIECGGAKDSESEHTAFDGINSLATVESLFSASADDDMEVLYHPVRIELKPGVTIAYHETLLEDVDITLWPDIEQCNHGITPMDRCLGWVGSGGLAMLQANNASGVDQLSELLREDNGWLYPAGSLQLFMATTDVRIARDDCMFYAVRV